MYYCFIILAALAIFSASSSLHTILDSTISEFKAPASLKEYTSASRSLPRRLKLSQQNAAGNRLSASDLTYPAVDYVFRERLLKKLVEECSQRRSSWIWLQGKEAPTGGVGRQQQPLSRNTQQVRVRTSLSTEEADDVDAFTPGGGCPLVDIPMHASERSVGMCTDAALYVLLLRGRIIPPGPWDLRLNPQISNLNSNLCPSAPKGRLFLENLDESSFADGAPASAVNLFLPNPEQLYLKDVALHRRMQYVLCKTRSCQGFMKR